MVESKHIEEEKIQKFWEDNQIYSKVKAKNKGNKLFNHIDGPPFPTGDVHLGHLRNWTIKDTILRFKRTQGFEVYARDGYDVHGLPVENKVQSKLGLKTVDDLKQFGEENFVKECKTYVAGIIDDMKSVRNRFGLWMQREQYQTSHPEYLSMAWKFFKKAEEKGLLYKDYKTVAWCPHDETTLSDYEIKDTYTTLEDPSIYVKFPINKEFTKTSYPESLVIWTTTPWTLQSNMAIAVNPEYYYSYVLVELNGKEEVLILANLLIESVIETISKSVSVKFIEILKTVKGAQIEGIKYDHIYLDETPSQLEFAKSNDNKHIHSVILADYVTLGEGEDIFEKLEKKGYKHANVSEKEKKENKEKENKSESEREEKRDQNSQAHSENGTGLVHIAPGHGFDDYEAGKKYNLPIFCPINEKGVMNEGKYQGMYFKDIDPIAIDYLKEKGVLLHTAMKSHRYPCCWRCKTPIVYRAADQWWIKRSELTPKIIKENSNVKWMPESSRDNFNNLTAGAGDWAISRQRYWGIPLPIFEDEDGNYQVFGSKEELEEALVNENLRGKERGNGEKSQMLQKSNFSSQPESLEDIHRDDLKNLRITNKKSGKLMKSVPFIADVWFDSGCASFASHYNEGLNFDQIIEKYYPIKWITEGEDQFRGWFSSLFSVGMMVTDKAPYSQVLPYRFIMDKNGVKMSKSLGNGISGNESIENWGADKTRYYLLTKAAPEAQINFDPEEFSLVEGFFNTFENIAKFMNLYLLEHTIRTPTLNIQSLDVEDLWILGKFNLVIESFTHNIENYKLNTAFKSLEEFIVRDLSKTYLKIIKDRTNNRDESLYIIFEKILKQSLILLSSAIPFKTEKLYQELNLNNKKESIFLEDLPEADELLIKEMKFKGIDENFELAQDIIAAVLNSREKVKIGVRWPLSEINIISTKNIKNNLKPFEKLIQKLTNISKISYDLNNIQVNYVVKPNFSQLKPAFKDKVSDAIKAINMNKFEISQDLAAGEIGGKYNDIEIDFEKHILKEIELKDDLTSSDFKGGNVILHTMQDEILLEEGFLRELIRRVQQSRKDFGFEKQDSINLSFTGSDSYFLELVKNARNSIMKKVGANAIESVRLESEKEYEIKDKKLIVSLSKI